MTLPTRYTLDEVLAAVEKGVTKTGTAHVLRVNRKTVLSYAKRWKQVAEAFEDKRRELVDLSELALRGAVLRNEPWAVTFTLRTLGKDEGYSERQEVTGKDGGKIEVSVEDAREKLAARLALIAARAGEGADAGEPDGSGSGGAAA